MEITTTTLGYAGLAAVAVIAILLARPWRRTTAKRFVRRPASIPRGRPGLTDWFASDPLLFVGADTPSADCGGGDGGGGSCD